MRAEPTIALSTTKSTAHPLARVGSGMLAHNPASSLISSNASLTKATMNVAQISRSLCGRLTLRDNLLLSHRSDRPHKTQCYCCLSLAPQTYNFYSHSSKRSVSTQMKELVAKLPQFFSLGIVHLCAIFRFPIAYPL